MISHPCPVHVHVIFTRSSRKSEVLEFSTCDPSQWCADIRSIMTLLLSLDVITGITHNAGWKVFTLRLDVAFTACSSVHIYMSPQTTNTLHCKWSRIFFTTAANEDRYGIVYTTSMGNNRKCKGGETKPYCDYTETGTTSTPDG